jgi:mono/diheme cytochrome c family protein/cytochrome c5
MRTFLKVFVFNIVTIAFFLYVGNSIPQLRQDPPQELVLAADAPIGDFVAAGQDIFYGKGTCALCHEIGKKGERCPDLAGVGEMAEKRIKEAGYKGKATTGAEYLVESLMDPTTYVVEGYQPSMPPVGRQLSDLELVAAVAFLQSQGGEVMVNGQSRFPQWRGEGGGAAPAAAAPAPATAAVTSSGASGQELVQQWGCVACHKLDGPEKLLGPSLWDIGARQDASYIRESILQPDSVVVEGFPAGLMKGTLDGSGFYQKVPLQDLNAIVDYLASLQGGK